MRENFPPDPRPLPLAVAFRYKLRIDADGPQFIGAGISAVENILADNCLAVWEKKEGEVVSRGCAFHHGNHHANCLRQ